MSYYQTSYSAHQYPIKITSRSAAVTQLRKLRTSWLMAVAAFFLGCAATIGPVIDMVSPVPENISTITAVNKLPKISLDANSIELLEEIVGATPSDLEIAENTEDSSYAANIENTSKESARTAASVADYNKPLELEVKSGDTLVSILTDAGIPTAEANSAFETIRTVFSPRKLKVGSSISLKIDVNENGLPVIGELKIADSDFSNIELTRDKESGFNIRKVNSPLSKKLVRVGGEIRSSIYQAGVDYGIPYGMLSEIVNAYSYDVDFQRDIKKGDSIDVLFEQMETEDGKVSGSGKFVFAELSLGNRNLKIYRYTDKDGNTGFYNEKGESVRKGLLRTPISGARITSGFGMRHHPIHGYNKMHKGVDFGAPIGTPIYAAGDGVVEAASWNGGYGKYLKIRHNNKYSSAYAHLSRYASGISPGKRVKQGQIVAYVGSTGNSTGPHLHYEIMANGKQVNPANVKFKTGNILQRKELAAFRENMNKINSQMASLERGKTLSLAKLAKSK